MDNDHLGSPEAPSVLPLAGVRVIDLATMLAGPLACQLLGDFGADVVKVEHPKMGDSLRGHGAQMDGVGLWWKVTARNKSCVGLYLGDPEGREIFLKLVATADVVVESFRPGTLERWGIGYERMRQANPRLILLRVSGFGQAGPYARRAGFGTLAESMSGFAAMTGAADGPPTLPPFGLADGIAGVAGAFATMMALYHRAMTGVGQVVDLAIYEPLLTVLGAQATIFDKLGLVPQRTGNRSANNAPRNTYLTHDGKWVAVSTSSLNIAQRVMRLVGHPEVTEEPWFSTGAGRAAHVDLLDGYVGGWIGEHTQAEVLDAFFAADAAVSPVYDIAEVVADPHIIERGTFVHVPDSEVGPLLMQDVLARFSASPGRVRFTGRRLGADTDAVLTGELGLEPAYVRGLRERGVVR
jgi:crotonobetainyl-CoA:carnitine CoA-transferase CaiB-like acyl-CoA transferase